MTNTLNALNTPKIRLESNRVKIATKVIGSKAYAKLAALANTSRFADGNPSEEVLAAIKTLELTFSNMDCLPYEQLHTLGLKGGVIDRICCKLMELPDDKFLVVSIKD